jgi:hypothetical protein
MTFAVASPAEPIDVPAIAPASRPRDHVMSVHCRSRNRLPTVFAAAALLSPDTVFLDLVALFDQHLERDFLTFAAACGDK